MRSLRILAILSMGLSLPVSAEATEARVQGFKIGLGIGVRNAGVRSPHERIERKTKFYSAATGPAFSVFGSYVHLIEDIFAIGVQGNLTIPIIDAQVKEVTLPDGSVSAPKQRSLGRGGAHLLLGANINGTMPALKLGYQRTRITQDLHIQGGRGFQAYPITLDKLSVDCLSGGVLVDIAVNPHFVMGLSATVHYGKNQAVLTDGTKESEKYDVKVWDMQVRFAYQF